MAGFEKQKAEKLTIHDVASRNLNGVLLKEMEEFIRFLKNEKITLPWKSINGFKMKYKGNNIGHVTIHEKEGGGDGERAYRFDIGVGSADTGICDTYLQDQTEEIIALFMENISYKCTHCRPTCGCSKASGMTVIISGEKHPNVCRNAYYFVFESTGDDMREVMMRIPRASIPRLQSRPVPLETVKKLILAKMKHIDRVLANNK